MWQKKQPINILEHQVAYIKHGYFRISELQLNKYV